MTTITIPQIDGTIRILAVSDEDAETVRHDPDTVYGIDCDCIGDLEPSGRLTWKRGGTDEQRSLVRVQARTIDL